MTEPVSNELIGLLCEMGILKKTDMTGICSEHGEVILRVLIARNALRPTQVKAARAVLQDFSDANNDTKRMRAKINFVSLITTNLHKRMETASVRMRNTKNRISSTFPSVPDLTAIKK
jgi:hypothetical protein